MRLRTLAAALLLLASGSAGLATPLPAVPMASGLCRSAILLAEHASHVPDRLLDAIATVESGRRDPASGMVHPWPWTINVEGAGHFYESKAEAIAAVQGFQAAGSRSIDVGCMQVNLMHHPDAFASLEQAFDPVANAAYAARFLTQLFAQTNAWPRAAAAYHSWTPELGAEYARRVLTAWGVPQPPPAAMDAEAIATMAQFTARFTPAPGGGGIYSAPAGGRLAVTMPAGSNGIRIVTLGAPGAGLPIGSQPQGRGLDIYRATPIYASGRLAHGFTPQVIRPTGF